MPALFAAVYNASVAISWEEAARTLLQALAILCMAMILSMIAHKGYVDVSLLAHRHSGAQFWIALAQYLIGNLAGGPRPAG
jgi:hypothetical protein